MEGGNGGDSVEKAKRLKMIEETDLFMYNKENSERNI
jgi:hypothetical protein